VNKAGSNRRQTDPVKRGKILEKIKQVKQNYEWNNLERIFKDNAVKYKCYSPAYSNGTLNIDVHPESVFEIAFKRHLNNKWEKYQYCNKKYDILDIEGNPVTVEMIIEKYEVKIVNELLLTPHQ